MANYLLTINSKFKPFSYAEMLAPVQAMTEAHQKIEDEYTDLMTKASVWDNLANEQSDPRAHAMYKSYADQLMLAADDLSRNGLTAQSRPQMMKLKAGYASYIAPIEKAYKRRRELAEEQRKYNAESGYTMRFDNDFSNISLDRLIENPELSYTPLSGKDIANTTSTMIANLAKSITTEPKYEHILNNAYWQSKVRSGFTPEEIISMAQYDDRAPRALKDLRNTIHSLYKSNPAYDKAFVDNWMLAGAYSGVGGYSYSTMQDPDHITPLQRAQEARANETQRWAREDRADRLVEISKDPSNPDGEKEQIWIDKDGFAFRNVNGKKVRDLDATARVRIALSAKYSTGSNGSSSGSGGSGSSGGKGASRTSRITQPVMITTAGNQAGRSKKLSHKDKIEGSLVKYENLTAAERRYVDGVIDGDPPENYTYYRHEASVSSHSAIIIDPKGNVMMTDAQGNPIGVADGSTEEDGDQV